MVGKESVDFHEPVGIERDTLSDFTGWKVLMSGEVLLVVQRDYDIAVLFVQEQVVVEFGTALNLAQRLLRMLLSEP